MTRSLLSAFASLALAPALWESPVVPIPVPVLVEAHGTMLTPLPRQPESVYWYQVGCMIGCECSGGGKEDYPSPESVRCTDPAPPTNTDRDALTYNAYGSSPRGDWNRYMPWRAPGTSRPIDSCGIASGFKPDAAVQYPHQFSEASGIRQGQRGTDLPPGPITQWEAGSIVDLSFYLVVNHGGGYQYRVCPKQNKDEDDTDTVDEACFERNPLVFADDHHTVFHGDRTIEIPATDVTDGVVPEGYAWRMIPLPACNCDSGSYCARQGFTDRDFDVSYDPDDAMSPYGSCPTGLQFVPPHIADGSWPEGYGYYVATLLAGKQDGGKAGFAGNTESPCAGHTDPNPCAADAANGCRWYPEKRVCYESRTAGGGAGGSPKEAPGVCADHTDEAACLAGSQNGGPCTWYDSPSKTVCYSAGDVGKSGTAKDDAAAGDRTDGEWHITDRVYAPTDPGGYVLQWRWDNEQTPQIWTTCADIEVIPEGQVPIQPKPTATETATGGDASGAGASVPPLYRSFVVSSALFFLFAACIHP